LSQPWVSPCFYGPPVHITLSGKCGTNVVIHYSDDQLGFGEFTGDVVCTRS
jgi:hypothetical protein